MMTSFFLLLSFLIHAILFITIYHLYEKTKKDKDEQLKQLEELLTDFMKNIQLENEKLEKKIFEAEIRQQVINDQIPNIYNQNSVREHVPKVIPETEKNESAPIVNINYESNESVLHNERINDVNVNNTNSNWDTSKLIDENEPEDILETSIEGQVLQLYKEGKSPEEIAKLLNRGKTEVDLYIKLNNMANN